MTMDIYSPLSPRLVLGVQLLEDELPAETSFYIPESFHKRIIGVAGKNIQKIMKKYGVYVKFSNDRELEDLGGYYENIDNVIARTPAKNAANLNDLKQVICESVNAAELLEEQCEVEIPRLMHRYLYRCILELQKLSVTTIIPDCELAIDTITLEGPLGSVESARTKLKSAVPMVTELALPATPATHAALVLAEFNKTCTKIYSDYGVRCLVYAPEIQLGEPEFDYVFYMVHAHLPQKTILEAKKLLLGYFSAKNVSVSNSDTCGPRATIRFVCQSRDFFKKLRLFPAL
jgi:KH domain